MIAALPMYDWPEERAKTDALWARLRDALLAAGFKAPEALTRDRSMYDVWAAQDLLLGETCSWPLATALDGKVRYVATVLRDAPGCHDGFYRSVIVRRLQGEADKPVPTTPQAEIGDLSGLSLAFNSEDSLSGHVALKTDSAIDFTDTVETGSHRASIIAVAEGKADIAAIDAYTWSLAKAHEPAAQSLSVIGWTAERPALPLVTHLTVSDEEISRMRQAILEAVPAIVHNDPLVNLPVSK